MGVNLTNSIKRTFRFLHGISGGSAAEGVVIPPFKKQPVPNGADFNPPTGFETRGISHGGVGGDGTMRFIKFKFKNEETFDAVPFAAGIIHPAYDIEGILANGTTAENIIIWG